MDHCEFETILVFRASSRTARSTQRNRVSGGKKIRKKRSPVSAPLSTNQALPITTPKAKVLLLLTQEVPDAQYGRCHRLIH